MKWSEIIATLKDNPRISRLSVGPTLITEKTCAELLGTTSPSPIITFRFFWNNVSYNTEILLTHAYIIKMSNADTVVMNQPFYTETTFVHALTPMELIHAIENFEKKRRK